MKSFPDIKPITALKTGSAGLIRQIVKKRSPVLITQNGEAKVVIQDVESYERDRKALLMLKLLAQGMQEIEQGKYIEQDELFAKIEKKFFHEQKV